MDLPLIPDIHEKSGFQSHESFQLSGKMIIRKKNKMGRGVVVCIHATDSFKRSKMEKSVGLE